MSNQSKNDKNYQYQVALSFAGEDRTLVENIAECLKNNDVSVFYDKYEEVDLWGKDLYTHLDDVYRNKAEYCIMFLSKHYKEKLWTNHERESAQTRAFQSKAEYILPIKIDDVEIPGIRPTTGYLDRRKYSVNDICERILRKIGVSNELTYGFQESDDIKIPKIKKTISEIEVENYLNESFQVAQDYFEKAVNRVASNYEHVTGFFSPKKEYKFTAAFHVEGDLKIACKIWITRDSFRRDSISYYQSNRSIELHNDNSMNDFATVEYDGFELYFKISAMGIGQNVDKGINRDRASARDVAKYFWHRFITNLEY